LAAPGRSNASAPSADVSRNTTRRAGSVAASSHGSIPGGGATGSDSARSATSRVAACSQGLTLVHFSSQLEPFLAQNAPKTPLIPPDTS